MWNSALRSDLVAYGEMDRDTGELAMSRLVAECEDIDGVFAGSDAMAAGAMWAPPLSSVKQPIEAMGREMARLVRTNGHATQHLILSPEIAVRQSTVAVR